MLLNAVLIKRVRALTHANLRLLDYICAGVDTLVLLNAAKVEKAYFGSHLLRTPAAIRAKLVEGLTQVSLALYTVHLLQC
jgi:hypothetical protein